MCIYIYYVYIMHICDMCVYAYLEILTHTCKTYHRGRSPNCPATQLRRHSDDDWWRHSPQSIAWRGWLHGGAQEGPNLSGRMHGIALDSIECNLMDGGIKPTKC